MNIKAGDWIYVTNEYYQQKAFQDFIQSLMRALGKECDVGKEQVLKNQIFSHVGSSQHILERSFMQFSGKRAKKMFKKSTKA